MLASRPMNEHVLIVGGGLAGLSAGCYARANGFRTTIIEHHAALGGVCTAWTRGGYTIDGCIHWLAGGPFTKLYEELGIVPRVALRTLDELVRFTDVERRIDVPVRRDLEATARALVAIAPEDEAEIRGLFRAARQIAALDPKVEEPPELQHAAHAVARVWDARHEIGALVRYRKPVREWLAHHARSDALRAFVSAIVPPDAPMLFLSMMLGYLANGWLSRPSGGTRAFVDALVDRYQRLGGDEHLDATVEEILVEDGRATGVRLSDGTMIDADFVVSTSSAPETVLHLLGGRFGARETQQRLREWKLFDPIVLVSFGVEASLEAAPPSWIVAGLAPFEVGGRTNDRLHLRVYDDDATMAPPGHTVVQAILPTDYAWWAERGAGYAASKDALAEVLLAKIGAHLPLPARAVRMIDVATPLTFWNMARSWRGAYEGWMPVGGAFAHPRKTLPGLAGFYMAGQWTEPGGGVPTAIMSGRQVVQLLCDDLDRAFTPLAIGAAAAAAPSVLTARA